ncbi:glycosyltransferase [Adhaeretor mobilis]|uniref:MurG-like transferase n=1 Tax=Adhaeretor mobilis TaxID=1930276 RepID=A0A517N277_9BACT|nr:nucleotide disphospho-sugar-binding domain-containing protein [Adhaeretor mobilis]QDT01233.1 MurG-like transferase [Adhaeretor mobilis]
MHLLLTALGSYGDVLPMVGLGAAMRERGHEVSVITNPHFREETESAGLDLVPLGTIEEYEELTSHPDLWRPIRGPKIMMELVATFARELYDTISDHYRVGETVLGSHGLDLAGRTFSEKQIQQGNRAPQATIHYAPLALRTMHDTPNFIGAFTQPPTPRWLKRLQFWLGDKLVIDRILGKEVNGLRAELGLPPVSRIYRQWHNSPELTLCFWPEWFGPKQPDWPHSAELVGFPLYDSDPAAELSEDVETFLNAGEPPIAFAPGSANTQAAKFFQTAVGVCEKLDRRGVLLTKYPQQIPDDLPPSVQHFAFVPFSKLLPRVAALVHHGGIGSCAQALSAGVPQLVMPMSYDQLDNATRLKRLGTGDLVMPKQFKTHKVAQRLAELFQQPSIHESCQQLAKRCDGAVAIRGACENFERLFNDTEKGKR